MPTASSSPSKMRATFVAIGNIVVPLFIVGIFLGFCLVHSSQTLLWLDEIYSLYPLTDRSLAHMLQVCRDTLNTAPPLYFLLGWLFVQIFGVNATLLRLFSSLAITGVALILWRILRPRYGIIPATVGICVALLIPEIFSQNGQIRFYGLYLFFVAITLERFARAIDAPDRSPRLVLLENCLVHFALLFTHTLGVLYSACLLLTMVLTRRRSPIFLAYCAGVVMAWVLFGVTWGGVTLHQQAMFHGYTWIPKPSLEIASHILFSTSTLIFYSVSIALLYGLRVLWERFRPVPDSAVTTVSPLVLAGSLFVILPTAITYIISCYSASFFLDRYLIPHALGWAVLLTAGLHHATCPGKIPEVLRQGGRYLAGISVLIFLIIPMYRGIESELHHPVAPVNAAVKYDLYLSQLHAPTDLPIVHTDPHTFLPTYFYDLHSPSRHIYVIDEERALQTARAGDGWQYSSDQNMVALQRGYLSTNIMTASELIRRYPRFIVVDRRDLWVMFRFADPKGRFQVHRLSDTGKHSMPIYLVEQSDKTKSK